jgi:hypothetical protein
MDTVWRPFGLGGRVPSKVELQGSKQLRKQLFCLLLDMPRALQRGRPVYPMPDQRPEQLFKLVYDDEDGAFVRNGWASTGTVLTNGVSLSVSRWRWPMPDAQLVAAKRAAVGMTGSLAQLDPELDVTRYLRPVNICVDPCVVKPVVAAVPLVKEGKEGESALS